MRDTLIKKEHSSKWKFFFIKWLVELFKGLGPRPHAVACFHSSLNDLLSCSKMSAIKTSFFPTWRLFFKSRTSPDAQIGLWTLSPPSSAVFPHPEPTIPFSYWSVVSHPSQRARHVCVMICPLFSLSEPPSFFPTGQWFPIPNHVTSPFPVGSGDVISGHVTSG